jgi:pyruvate/2-oxoglutarate dehydrogenase complex dihydrolipoamide acyltransferase (E2) component
MKKTHVGFAVVPYPKVRRVVNDIGLRGRRKPIIHGLMEMDVTESRRILQDYRTRTGDRLSFTAYIASCLARALEENKSLNAYRKGRKRLVIFDDVDLTILVEHRIEGERVPTAHVCPAANRKTIREIHQDISNAQAVNWQNADIKGFRRILVSAPGFVRRFLWQRVRDNPFSWKKQAGTVVLSAVGMFGSGAAWGIPITFHSLGMTIGGIAEKPGIIDGRIEVRRFLSVTLSVDHDIIDGAPLARFTQRLRELIESGYGLDEQTIRLGRVAT